MPRGSTPPLRLFHRHRDVLASVAALGGATTLERLQRLLHLRAEEAGAKAPYDFVLLPDEPISFTLRADLDKLEEHGLLEASEGAWRLTEAGAREAEATGWDPAALVGRLPATTEAGSVPAAPATTASVPTAAARERGPALLSIGYEGRSLEAYLSALLDAGATLLCDVRRNPLSRKFGFSKRTLAHACREVGIRYEHLPELGIEASKRRGVHGDAAFAALFERYRREWLPQQRPALETIEGWLRDGERVALTCFERDELHCHRHMVAEALGEPTIQL